MDVVRQRFERRDVDDLRRIGQPPLEPLADEIVDRREKGGERLAGAGRRGDQHVAALLDRRPRLGLRGGRRGEMRRKPMRRQRDGTGSAPRRDRRRATASAPTVRRGREFKGDVEVKCRKTLL